MASGVNRAGVTTGRTMLPTPDAAGVVSWRSYIRGAVAVQQARQITSATRALNGGNEMWRRFLCWLGRHLWEIDAEMKTHCVYCGVWDGKRYLPKVTRHT